MVKGNVTKYIRFENEKELKRFLDALDTNDKEIVLDIIFKIHYRKDIF